MPPKLGQIRRGIAPGPSEVLLSRGQADPIRLPLPLFWDSPPWHQWPPAVAEAIFEAMQSRGVLVSALESELGRYRQPNGSAEAEKAASSGSAEDAASKSTSSYATTASDSELGIPRMLPYRNERYGLSDDDFEHASVIDMRLSPPRDVTGRFAYSADCIRRWEATADDAPLSGGGWVPAMTLPPDVPGVDRLRSKVNQLRGLSPRAAVVISVTPEWIDENLSDLIAASADALSIRMGQLRMKGIALAHFVRRLLLKVEQVGRLPIWLTPPKSLEGESLTVSDSIKILALGVSAIAVDSWLEDVIEEIDEIPPPSSFDANPKRTVTLAVEEILQRLFDFKLEQFAGMYSSLIHERPEDLLGTFDPEVAELLNLPCVGRL